MSSKPIMILFSIGGSHRKFERDVQTLKRAGVVYRMLGAATLGSKRRLIGVSSEDADRVKALGFSKSRTQWGRAWHDPQEKVEETASAATVLPYELHGAQSRIGTLIVNPGSGTVRDAEAERAQANIQPFLDDLALPGLRAERLLWREEGGRYGFRIRQEGNKRAVIIDMPGLPLEQVRYVGAPGQNIWHFPRLFVDEDSYVWCYALNVARNRLLAGEKG